MSRVFLSLVVAALLAFPAASGVVYGGPPIDPSALGQQVQAKAADGQIVITRSQAQMVYETEFRTETRTRVIEVDGEKREETVAVEVPVTVPRVITSLMQQKVALESAEAYDMQGKRVAADQFGDALKEERTILLATRKVPRYYLTVYKPDTLLLVIAPQVLYGSPVPSGPALLPVGPGVAPPKIDAPRTLPAPAPVPGDPPKVEAPRALPAPTAPAPGEAAPKPDAPPKPTAPRTLPAPTVPAPAGDAPAAAVLPALAAAASSEPLVSMARIVDDKLGLRRYVKDISSETALREEDVDGVKKLVPVSIEVETITDVERKYLQNLVKIYRADKKPLAEDEIARLKDSERCVLVSSDGKEVDPKYLKIVKPEALIVVAPISQPLMPHIVPVPGRPTLPLPAPVPAPQPPSP
jgi:hypothetical protein